MDDGGKGPTMTLKVDTQKLRSEISEKYTEVAKDPSKIHHFHTGRFQAERLAYASDILQNFPDQVIEPFAGVGNPFALGEIMAGETVLDVGSGGGFDSLIAAQKVGTQGKVIGVDMTEAMLAKARENAELMGATQAEFRQGVVESLPVDSESVDVVISNGVINLCPDKAAVYSEIFRVLRPGGRIMIADIVVQKEVPQGAKEDIDLWTG